MHKVDLIVGLILLIPMIILGAILVRRQAYRELPRFCVYIACSLAISILRLIAIRRGYSLYFGVYWTTQAVYAITALFALYESFRWEFLDFCVSFKWSWCLFPMVTSVFLVPAIVHVFRYPPSNVPRISPIVLSLVTAVDYVTGGLVAVFFIFVFFLTYRLQRYPFGIVIGFALHAWGSWATCRLSAELGPADAKELLKYALPASYQLAVAVWLYTFSKDAPPELPAGVPRATPKTLLEQSSHNLQVLNKIGEITNDL